MFKNIFSYLLGDKGNTNIIPLAVKSKANFANVAYHKDSPKNIPGYGEYLPKFSNDDIRVYKNPESKTLNVSIRGTDLSKSDRANKDLLADIKGVFLGYRNEDPRFYDANRTVQTLEKRFPDYKINTFGHSLGATISQDIAKNNPNVNSFSFNPGAGLPELFQTEKSNSTIYRIAGDPISYLGRKGETYNIDTVNPHSLENFV